MITNFKILKILNKPKIVKFKFGGTDSDNYDMEYAMISIFGKHYKVMQSDYPEEPGLIIEDFPVDNCSEKGYNSGFMAPIRDIAELLNEIDASGGIEEYLASKKYNL